MPRMRVSSSNVVDPQAKLSQAKKFEKIIKLKMSKWTDEDWKWFDRYCELGEVPKFAMKKDKT